MILKKTVENTSRETAEVSTKCFADSLAKHYQAVIDAADDVSSLPSYDLVGQDLKKYRNWFENAYHHFQEISESGNPITVTAEWILDNHYIIQQAISQIEEDLSQGYLKKLPKLSQAPQEGFPRVFAISRSIVQRQNYLLDVDNLIETMLAFQENVAFSMGELWAIPIFLRFALLEKLAYVLSEVIEPTVSPGLPNYPPIWAEPKTDNDRKQNEVRNSGDIVATIIPSLSLISETDWKDVFEEISLVEDLLRKDPAGIYPLMDFNTRNKYRREIESLALASGVDEIEVSKEVLLLCQEAAPDEGLEGDALKNARENKAMHVGTYLVSERRQNLQARLNIEPSLVENLKQWASAHNQQLYLAGITSFALILIIFVLLAVHKHPLFSYIGVIQVFLMAFFSLCMIPIAFITASVLMNTFLTALVPPDVLPKMDFKESIPPEFQTLVVIPGMITDNNSIENLVRQLEIHYLSNSQPGLKFAILTDFADADSETRPEDESLLRQALQAIAMLDHKYVDSENERRFFLMHRRRLWNPSQGKWMGWERKRGKLEELNKFLRGSKTTSFLEITADENVQNALKNTRFVITLDADTVLPPGTAVNLIGTLAHPLNQAEFDSESGRVIKGYTILQPRVEVHPRSANLTWFTRIFAGDTGLDLYTHAVSDIYQDLFGEGNFVGKGIYDVDAFMRSVEGRIPENTLLSHDLFEGILGRAGLVSDISLIEDYPKNYYERVMQQRRWIRGDWQLLPWLINPAKFNVSLSAVDRWKMLHNLLRSLFSPALLTLILLGMVFLPELAWLWVLILLVAFGIPLATAIFKNIVDRITERRRETLWPSLWPIFMRWLFALIFLPYEAYYSLDANFITLYRLLVSRRNLLTWTTAEHTSALFKFRSNRNKAWIKLSLSAILSALFVLVAQFRSIITDRASFLAYTPIIPIFLLWILGSGLVSLINQPIPSPKNIKPFKQVELLRTIARHTWGFFEHFVSPQDHWLPPDHFQETPIEIIAHHTSPSNIGLYLTSAIAAYDLGYLDLMALASRLDATLQTLQHLERHRGHFLNWYDTQTLEPLHPRYVSTVDSGNLAASFIILSQTSQQMLSEPVFRWELWQGYLDDLNRLFDVFSKIGSVKASPEITMSQENIGTMRNRIRAVKNQPGQWYALFQNVLNIFWVDLSQNLKQLINREDLGIDLDDLHTLQEIIRSIENQHLAVKRVIEDLVPWIHFLESIPDLLKQKAYLAQIDQLGKVLAYNPRLNEIEIISATGIEYIEALQNSLQSVKDLPEKEQSKIVEAKTWLLSLFEELKAARIHAQQLQSRFESISSSAEQFIEEMDFTFLFNPSRKVFHIGYNLETGQLDKNYYDLLASEARIASLITIAKEQVPQSHWMYLNRPITRIDGSYALLSWSATMFEYLMPALYFRSQPNTLLYVSATSAIRHQRAYAKSKDVPWGISESGFFQFDANHNYQYRAFGVPGLGFKRGLGDDLVIAPYASLIAIKWAPSEVEENLLKLIEYGTFGLYGFYEAIDFTAKRLPVDSHAEVVQEYMSHHHGMTMMALVNYLYNDIMVERMHNDPQIESMELLLQEQMPFNVPLLKAGEEEIKGSRPVNVAPVEIKPLTESVDTAEPMMHLLSNGSYSTFISNRGGGFSRWKGIDLTRWREDGTLDPWGTWIYIQDMQNVADDGHYLTWSAAQQPIPTSPNQMQVSYLAHMVVFHRTQNDLASTMKVTVAAEDPVEIRHLTLINNQDDIRHLRLTSYGEVILNQQANDMRHPAYNKLFIESEYVPELNLQIFKRRPHGNDEQVVLLGHMMVFKAVDNKIRENFEVAHEADRRNFIGRQHTLRYPLALQTIDYLSGTSGATLDPIFSLGREITLQPHDVREVAFLTFTANSRRRLLDLAKRYSNWSHVNGAFQEAENANLTWLGRQKIDSQSFKANLQLLSALLYNYCQLRAKPETLAANRFNQTDLWRFGISGDYPIILLMVNDVDQLDLIHETVKAQSFLRMRGFQADLVILIQQASAYSSELGTQILRRIKQANADQWINQRGGIYMRYADQITTDEQILLKSAARVYLHANRETLTHQLQVEPVHVSDLPFLTPTLPTRRNLSGSAPWEKEDAPTLKFFNGFGGFSQDGKEYVIHVEPDKTTPSPWVNVIGYPHFGFMVSQAGSQTTWALNSGENRLTPWHNDPVIDPSGEVVYLRDEESGDVWTPTPQPIPAGQPCRVRHGAGYTIFETESFGLQQELTLFASPKDPVKIFHLRIKNMLNSHRRITATCYLEWVLGVNRAESIGDLIPDYNPEHAMLTVRNPYHPEMGDWVAFLMANRTLHGFTTDRLEFFGKNGSLSHPIGLLRLGLTGKLATGSDVCAALQLHIDMAPNGSDEIYFVLGEGENQAQIQSLAEKYQDPTNVDDALNQTHNYWDNLLGRIQVMTPDDAANLMLNRWWLYQTISCRLWGRSAFYQSSGAFGFRDQLQDVLALPSIDPAIVKEQILNAASHQFKEGDVLHWWHPPSGRGVRTRISDNLLWLPYVACHYVSTSGDTSLWDEKIPFLDAPPLKPDEHERYGHYGITSETYTLFEHCQRALQKGSTQGPNGLPLIGAGDWNDGFNMVGKEGKGESIWLAWFLCDILNRFADVCDQRGDEQAAQTYRTQAQAYAQAVEKCAWDGNWYLRAFYDDGTPLGSQSSDECKIDSIAQSWALISDAGDLQHGRQAMDAVWEHLVKPDLNLCLLFAPPFDKGNRNPGYIKSYPPGVRENGGQYTHAAAWTCWALANLGDSIRAWHLYDMLNPIYHSDYQSRAQHYRVEPYVSAADVYSQGPRARRGGWTWYTGSAAWLYRLGIESLLGFDKEGDKLYIDPVIPPNWDGFLIQYRHGNSLYKIQVHNPLHRGKGVSSVVIDGEQQSTQIVSLTDDSQEHYVDITLG
jgi:cyclic beta-1,2-glucan synthetase